MSWFICIGQEAEKHEWRRHDRRMAQRRVAQMTANSKTAPPARERSTWFQIAQFLFLVVLAVALYFLGLSMVHSRFHRGGHLDWHGHISR